MQALLARLRTRLQPPAPRRAPTEHEQVELHLPTGSISCDAGIAELVEALNLAGVPTAFSCEGYLPTPELRGEQAYLALEIEGWCRLRDRLVAASSSFTEAEHELLDRMGGGLLDCIDPEWGEEPLEWNTVAMIDRQHLRATGLHAMRLLCYFHPADIPLAARLVRAHALPGELDAPAAPAYSRPHTTQAASSTSI